jgi:hypothetical protein
MEHRDLDSRATSPQTPQTSARPDLSPPSRSTPSRARPSHGRNRITDQNQSSPQKTPKRPASLAPWPRTPSAARATSTGNSTTQPDRASTPSARSARTSTAGPRARSRMPVSSAIHGHASTESRCSNVPASPLVSGNTGTRKFGYSHRNIPRVDPMWQNPNRIHTAQGLRWSSRTCVGGRRDGFNGRPVG